MRTAPGDTANSWDAFYAHWVKPVVHFGTPTLIVFAVLMTLAVIVTPLVVEVGAPGVRSGSKRALWALRGAYWLGVLCLLFSAVEATIVFPLSRDVPSARHAPWTAGVSIGLITAAVIVGFSLLVVVGKPRPENRTVLLWGIGTLCLVAAVPIAGLAVEIGPSHWPSAWLSGKLAVVIYAVLLAVLGGGIVARTRGIGIGLLIQGHDKAGADDAGLGAFVRARLYSLGSQEPKGILVTQQTDTSTLPSGALGLIPAGSLAKVAALFVSLFAPPTPWRVDVTEQDDGSIVVAIRRNGRVADAAVIRPSTLELPSKPANGGNAADGGGAAAGAGPSAGDPGGSGAGGDWTTELRTAAATFILLALSRRFHHLRAGLCGATDWRSVALQVIAADPASQLSAEEKHAVLVHAVADDRGNMAAELALLNDCYRTASGPSELGDFAVKLKKLLKQLPDNEGTLPLRLRSRFNMIVAYVNYAAALTPGESHQAAYPPAAHRALEKAEKQAELLLAYWSKPAHRDKYPALWQSMYAAVNFAAQAIEVELSRSLSSPVRIRGVLTESEIQSQVNMTLLARYELACALTRDRATQGTAKAGEYRKALDELEIAVADPAIMMMARTDPSLAELHDVDQVTRACAAPNGAPRPENTAAEAFDVAARFKDLVGAHAPEDFLSLSPFAAHRDALALRGIHDAAGLRRTPARRLRSELSITPGEVARWRQVTKLYRMAGGCQAASGNGNRATEAVFLLLQADLDSVAAVSRALTSPGQLRQDLLGLARNWAVVAPGEEEIGAWGRHLGVPRH